MLSLQDGTRRDFLKVGSLALGGLTLEHLLQANVAANGHGLLKDKAVILLFMQGGPSQFETFDPKMEAPAEIRSVTGEIATKLPGITFGSTFPQLAQLADRLAIVRSFTTGDARHDLKPVVHRDTFNANMGTLYARVAGMNHPKMGMPRNVLLLPKAIDKEAQPALTQFGNIHTTGPFSGSLAPFAPGAGGSLQQDMKLNMAMDRLENRRLLLRQVDQARWAAEKLGLFEGVNHLRGQAFQTILGGLSEAFDLSKEDPGTVARYDTSKISRPDNMDKKLNNHKFYVDNGKTLGKLLLLARRLCERGAGFVTVTTNFVWDMHADVNNAGVAKGMQYMGLPFDHAVSAFLEDVHQRGLSDKILLVCCGEMGRTPRLNNRGGRDHWGSLAPLLVAGGGLKMGQVIGESTRDGSTPQTEPITIKHLVSTILNTLVDGSQLRLTPDVPREIIRATTDWQPIPGLHS